jgi:hypothetical protein
MFLGLSDPDPLVRGMDPHPAPDPSVIKQILGFLCLKHDVNVLNKSNKQKIERKLVFCWPLEGQ